MVRVPKNRTPTHPGKMLLEEFLKPINLTQQDLAMAIHVPYQRVNELVNGRRGITPATALRLSRFFGNTAASLFYQHFQTELKIDTPVIPEVILFRVFSKKNEDKGYFNPNFEIGLGFGWGSYFYEDSWHIDIAASYEFHIFWNQNMMRKIKDTSALEDPHVGNLILHGLTVALTLDF